MGQVMDFWLQRRLECGFYTHNPVQKFGSVKYIFFIQQGCMKLIKGDRKYIYIVKGFIFELNIVILNFI